MTKFFDSNKVEITLKVTLDIELMREQLEQEGITLTDEDRLVTSQDVAGELASYILDDSGFGSDITQVEIIEVVSE